MKKDNKTREQLIKDLKKSNAKIAELEKLKIESKRAKEELEKTRERLELAMDAGEHGFWDWNLDTNDIYFSPRYYTMLGYEPGELPMRLETWVNLMHPDDQKTIVPEVENYVKNAQPYEVEFRLKTKDRNWRWISGRGKSYKKDKAGIPHRAVGVHVDITGRKKAEQALMYSEEKFREMAELLPEVVYECDVQGNLNFVNRVAFKRFGYTQEDFDKGVNALQFIVADDRKRTKENIEKILRGTEKGPFEYIAQRKDDSEFPIIIYSSPIIRDGKPVGIRGIITDITEHKYVEEELIKHRKHLEELVKERTKQLEEKNKELKRYNNLFEGRELRIKELRDKVKELERKLSG